MVKPHLKAVLEVDGDLVIPDDGLTLLPDDVLLDLVRGGSADAYGVLFERYRHPAYRLATYFSNAVDAKDIVAETFADVLHQLRRGQGPHTSFRSYLFTSVRREAGKRAKLHKRVRVTDDMATIDKPVPFGGGGADTFERELVRAAFASLPARWRTVLWQLDVDGRKPHELASHLGLKPNAVSALAYRAREGLRKAYLEQHVLTKGKSWATACGEVRRRLVAFVRGSATTSDVIMIDPHLETCVSCMDVYLELEEVNTHLGAVSSALAIGFAAPATATLVSGTVAKATFIAKSIAAALGSTAAVVATSVTVLNIPVAPPAHAEAIHAFPVLTPEEEPDRAIGPAAAPTTSPKKRAAQDDEVFSAAAAAQALDGQEATSTPPDSPSLGGLPPVAIDVNKSGVSASVSGADIHIDKTGVSASVSGADIHIDKTGISASVSRTADINVDKAGVSASASAAGVDATASVELREPQDTRSRSRSRTRS